MTKKPPIPSVTFLEERPRESYVDLLLALAKEYGPLVKLNRFSHQYLVSDPELVHHLLVSERGHYVKEPMSFNRLGKLLGNGLLTNLNDSWLERRRYLQKAFQREQLAAYEQQAIASASQYLTRWQLASERTDVLNLGDEMLKLVLTLICKNLFSIDLTHDEGERLIQAGFKGQMGVMRSLILSPWIFTRKNNQFFRARAVLRNFAEKIIQERKNSKTASPDLLSLLLEGEEYRDNLDLCIDEVVTFIMAGHETTASALTWMWYLLSQHPDVLQNVIKEVDSGAQLPFCKQVFEETLRLYPPIWGFPRRTVCETELGGFTIPRGATFILSPYVIHRMPTYWEEPDAFKPERFDPARRDALTRHAYMPFGGGMHVCIANQLALRQAVIVLSTIIKQFALEIVSTHPQPMPLELLVSLRPGQKILAKVRAR